MKSCSSVGSREYLCLLDRASANRFFFPAICSMTKSNSLMYACQGLASFKVCHGLRKESSGWWSVRSVNLWPQSYSPKNFKESTIASNSFWKLGYFSCAGLNFREWNPQGRIDSSSPWPIHDPSPISLASHTRYFGASERWSQGLRICGEFTSSLIFSSALVWVSVHLQGAFSP